jgi:cyanate lyase
MYFCWELVELYGTKWKALIEAEFNDAIMGAIDFT